MTEQTQQESIADENVSVSEENLLDNLLSKVDRSMKRPDSYVTIEDAIKQDTSAARISHAVDYLVKSVLESNTKIDKLDKQMIDSVIESLDTKISDQLNEIIHNEKFQELESAWRGLKFAIDRTNFRSNIKVEMLNCSKEKLLEDFEDNSLFDSGLYKQLYKKEYDTPGADPFSFIVTNFEFKNIAPDISLLHSISKVSSATHCPCFSSVGSEFFGKKKMEELASINDINEIFTTTEYAKWNTFRETEDSRYIGLTMNKFLLRMPYGPETDKVKGFNFIEDAKGEAENYLWGNPSFALMSNLNRSFTQNGWTVRIRGVESGGKVANLPLHTFQGLSGAQSRNPAEITIEDTTEFDLSENGFIPLCPYKNKDFCVFQSVHSAQKPKKYDDPDATANAALPANLPYMLLVSRLAHYLKVIQRKVIGSQKGREELEKELNNWIQGLVTTQTNPTQETIAKYPLASASVEVTPSPGKPGFYHVSMKVKPHFQVEGVNIDLSLVSRMPSKK